MDPSIPAPSLPAPTGQTRLAAVIGDPVRHSLSPVIHNAAFAATGLDWVYVALPVSAGGAARALDAARLFELGGLSVTMPHKADVAEACDELSPDARRLGAVNCVVVAPGGPLVGHNTDGPGFLGALTRETPLVVEGCRAVVLGAGGAARAVVLALARAGAEQVTVVARRPEAGAEAATLAGERGRAAAVPPPEFDLVVNATPVGMGRAGAGRLPLEPTVLGEGQVVVDLVYDPLETPLMAEARRRGALVAGGVGMLVGQAAEAFRLWTGVAAPIEVMHAAVAPHLRS